MSESTYREYTCDRCGKQERRSGFPDWQPSGWLGVDSFTPGRSSEGMPDGRTHLCPRCARQLNNFLTRLPEAGPEEVTA